MALSSNEQLAKNQRPRELNDESFRENTNVRASSTYTGADQREHDALIKSERLALFHFDALLVEAFHRVHFARVRFPAAVHLAEPAASDDSVHAEVVHGQLERQNDTLQRC